ncbi:putative monooxygenase YcnE [Methanimicrococcus sp. At1]|uniref:Monooxygenase YcnE n=1 Tax=Methanimicrococcus hacksteinii TaxID=3028293 RepID=A0ABU3VR81_9EURY|nr:putative quinol monooxygenase [Methanimicrococcus sp. At1]MDV0445671.1 putative monooxygenase YcnE [Methanimicrococcus sp. At1]
MLIVNAVIKIKPGTEEEFLEKVQPLLTASRRDEGCISYALFKNTEEENSFMMIEQWESPEMLDKHTKEPHFIKFGEDAGPLMAAALDIQTYPVAD